MKLFTPSVLLVLLILLISSSCSKYQKVLKSSDLTYKYEMTEKYYNEGEYYKAYPLLEELVTVYRGSPKAEKLHYMYAYSDFYLKDYIMAAYRFEQFRQYYPYSQFVEDATYMTAFCYYKNSPNPSLDPTNTLKAMNELQYYINSFPSSSKVDTCNILVTELRHKLEDKYFDIATQYYKTLNYKAAVVSFQTFMNDYSDSKYAEEATYMIFKSQYTVAENSLQTKQLERYLEAKKYYNNFKARYPSSKFLKEADVLMDKATKEIEKLNQTSS